MRDRGPYDDPATREGAEAERLGLCAGCSHHRRVPTRRGVTYHRCALADTRPGLERYPRLPVRACDWRQPAGS